MPETTILFVEDNEDLRENAALVLSLEGYTVQLASDGQEALEILDTGIMPHLIVSDIMMPRMDGYEFFKAVRRRAHLRGVPFIFLTARGSRRDISTGKLLGVDDYLVKPFDPEDFLIAVQNKIQRAADMRAQAAESLNEARRLLVQLLSHELRTPLTYVTGGFALLAEELEGTTADDIRISLALIQSGTQRLNRLAEQMVLYSEIMSEFINHQIEQSCENWELETLLADALNELNDLTQEHNTSFRHIMPENDQVVVRGAKDLLVRAISEVLRNAIQYSPEGAQVDLIIEQQDNYGVLTIVDQGMGIPADKQETIWDVLIQVGRERTEQQGAGMGLPIAKGIMTAHNGDVHLYSVPNEGTKVSLTFPLAAPSTSE
ncbi:MAG: response regulator [Anaerolineae bacterium]|nr:response regulator [Anaerolineae bacterium]